MPAMSSAMAAWRRARWSTRRSEPARASRRPRSGAARPAASRPDREGHARRRGREGEGDDRGDAGHQRGERRHDAAQVEAVHGVDVRAEARQQVAGGGRRRERRQARLEGPERAPPERREEAERRAVGDVSLGVPERRPRDREPAHDGDEHRDLHEQASRRRRARSGRRRCR